MLGAMAMRKFRGLERGQWGDEGMEDRSQSVIVLRTEGRQEPLQTSDQQRWQTEVGMSTGWPRSVEMDMSTGWPRAVEVDMGTGWPRAMNTVDRWAGWPMVDHRAPPLC